MSARHGRGAGPESPAERRVVWSERAAREVTAIWEYIAQDSPEDAARWAEGTVATGSEIGAMPLAGRRVPEVGRDDVREVIRGTYRIMYRVTAHRVDILAVREGHRLFPPDLALPKGRR